VKRGDNPALAPAPRTWRRRIGKNIDFGASNRHFCAEHPKTFADLGDVVRLPGISAANPPRHAERA
jgi:hypothetical protein